VIAFAKAAPAPATILITRVLNTLQGVENLTLLWAEGCVERAKRFGTPLAHRSMLRLATRHFVKPLRRGQGACVLRRRLMISPVEGRPARLKERRKRRLLIGAETQDRAHVLRMLALEGLAHGLHLGVHFAGWRVLSAMVILGPGGRNGRA